MKRLRLLISLLLASLILALAGCDMPTALPPCTAEQLQAPIDLNPNSESVVLDPAALITLQWGYPPTTCAPDFFEAYVWTGPEPETYSMTGRVQYVNAASPGVWKLTWPILLQPGNTYYWRVSAGLETGPGPDVNGPSALGYFFTGPECTMSTTMQPVNLLSPPDDIRVAPDEAITFAWDDPTPCLVNGLFEIDFSQFSTMIPRLYAIPILQTVYTTTPSEIFGESLETCTRYYWRIKTDRPGEEGPFSETRSFFIQPEGILCPTVPTLHVPIVIARVDLNCRLGPSPDYSIEDAFYAGEQAPIEGRSADGDWWLITSPTRGARCWVWGEQTDVEGDTSGIAIVEPPPLILLEPTLTEETPPPTVNCAQYTDAQSCTANPACQWHTDPPTHLPPGHCENK